MKIEIRKVSTNKEIKQFIDFPHALHDGDPYYVPEIYLGQKEMHNQSKNPYFKHAKAQLYTAWKGNQLVGRIAVHISKNYNEYHNSNVGFFGFYDVVDDVAVSKALFDAATAWLRAEKAEKILGPSSYSLTTDTGGLLVEGFDSRPLVMMTYNPQYYMAHVEACGFTKEMDLFAYEIMTKNASDKAVKLQELLLQRLNRSGITVRNINLKKFQEEISGLKHVYTEAWQDNWGFVPPTDEELAHLGSEMKMVVDPDFVYIAEHEGRPVGFSVTLPDINEITKDFKRGRLFPFNIFKLLLRRRKVKRVRILLLGILDDYRNKGIEAVFYAMNINKAKEKNLVGGEASWILENNQEMVKGAEKLNGRKYKTYRIYSQDLNG